VRGAGVELMRSDRSIYIAVLTLVVTMGLGAYVDLKSDAMHTRHLEVSKGLERMVRLNQQLTNMLIIAVLEQNTLRTASYDTLHADFEATVQTVGKLTQGQSLTEEITALSDDHRKLQRVEDAAIQYMRADRWTDARRVLFDESYVLTRKMYEINSETAISALTGALAMDEERFNRIRLAALALRTGAVVLLLWVGAMFSRRLRTELAEQARLQNEITASHQALEEKVLQRTVELEDANRRLQALSATDGLTGLANRRKFDQEWEQEWSRAVRQGLALAVAMVDVDQFKAYNDHYGHPSGDVCLKLIAQTLGHAVQRSGELAARYGGEEFVVILPGLDATEAAAVMERVREAVQALGLPHARAAVAGVVTVSAGVAACVPRPGDDAAHLLQAADAAMYRAKTGGRNRVERAADR